MKSKLKKMRLENLHQMDDGTVAAEFDMKLKDIVKDIFERQSLNKARTITLELSLAPSQSRNFRVNTRVKISTKKPPARTPVIQTTLQDGELQFNPESLDDVDQMIFKELARDEEQHAELEESEQ